jgi:hypothetical protein
MFYLYESFEDIKEEIRIRKSGELIQWPEEIRIRKSGEIIQ